MTPYEEKLEAIAEAKNEHEQIERHFANVPDGTFMSNGILYCKTCNRAMSTNISDTREECERLARIVTTQKASIKTLQRACKKWFDKARENRKEVVKLLAQIEKMKCCENCAYRTIDLLTFKPFCDKRKLGIENPLTCKCDKWKLVK